MELESAKSVELVAGPLCGKLVPWPTGNVSWGFAYKFGQATYELESKSTAIYQRG